MAITAPESSLPVLRTAAFAGVARLCLRLALVGAVASPSGPALAQSGGMTATLNATGGPQHVVRTQNGGAEWLMSGYTIGETGRLAPGGSVAFKTWNDNFGWRWDTQQHETGNNTYNWFNRQSGNARSFPETLDEEMRAVEAAGWTAVYCQPTPKELNATATGKGAGYLWQTHHFYASMAEYIAGRADADWQARVAAMPTRDANDPRNAGFNWANLRAARGHVAPYPVYGFCVGTEPYWVEDLPSDQYVREYLARARAIRAKVPDAKLGLFLQASGDNAGKWDGQLVGAGKITADLVDFLILRDNYHGHGNPRAENLGFFLGAYNARHVDTSRDNFNSDGTIHLYSEYRLPATTNYYAEHARQWVDKHLPGKAELKERLVWTEWGYCISCQAGSFNDLGMAVMRTGQFAEAFKDNVLINATWTLNNEPPYDFGLLARRADSFAFNITPSQHAVKLLHQLVGSRYLPTSVTSPTYEVDPPNTFPRLRINYLDAWMFEKDGDRFLLVINRHTSEAIRLNGDFGDYGPISWKQIGGHGFTYQSSNKDNPNNVVTRDRAVGPLVFEPLSINVVRLSRGAGGGGGDGRIWGDVSTDGVVNSTDALGTLSYTVGLPNGGYDYSVADVNADGQITTTDALIDLHYSVGLDVSGHRVGQPVGGGNGDLVVGPQLSRAPRPSDARVYVGLRPARPGRRRGAAQVAGGGDLRLVLRAARHGIDDPLGAFHVRLTWDPARLRFRAAEPASESTQLLMGVNDSEAARGSLVVAGATPGELTEELMRVSFERLAAGVDPSEVQLDVLAIGASRTGEDLTSHVEVRSEKVDPEGETSGEGGGDGDGLGLPYPNPARGRVSIPVALDAARGAQLAATGDGLELVVFDVRGRVVKRLLRDETVAGQRVVDWDGTDEAGRRVPAGIYVVQLRAGDTRETRKVLLY